MVNGVPAFFERDQEPFVAFEKFWEERGKVYKELANYTAKNNSDIDSEVNNLISLLK